ncbi:hypothetical protein [Conexibacter woesei]|uniref:hypothetical protein n=1 Tax=Conexibacter woesei TaxID=191495 RepID=UPI00040B6506|nr:hypothetical protein [Conexibacter woesei]
MTVVRGRRLWALVAVTAVAVAAIAAGAALLLGGGDDGGAHAASRGPALAWAPPRLHAPQTIHVTAARAKLKLDPRRDYRVVLPRTPVRVAGGLTIAGGRNVVVRGGQVVVPWQGARPASGSTRRGLFLTGQTGTVHVEGLRLSGDLGDGIDLDERLGATVQLENIRVDRVTARDTKKFSDTHPDVVQSWAGPKVLRIDRLSAATDYQGFFLLPDQFAKGTTARVDLRHVDLVGSRTSAYLLWRDRAAAVTLRDVRLTSPGARPVYQTMWPTPAWWPGARVIRHAPRTLFASPRAGISYTSPGYR